MQFAFIYTLSFLVLVACHECGHIVSAKLMGLTVEKVGFTWKPWPHPYVMASNVPDNFIKYLFLFSGPLVTLILFGFAWPVGLLAHAPVYYAFTSMIIAEYNPYYSDFTIATERKDYQYSPLWCVHFMSWIALMAFLLAPPGLRQWLHP